MQLGLWLETTTLKLEVGLAFLNSYGGSLFTRDAKVVNSYCYSKVWKVDLVSLVMTFRIGIKQQPMTFQVPYARTDIYKYSFFPDTIKDWNAFPASLISSADNSGDSVARFTPLVRSRD